MNLNLVRLATATKDNITGTSTNTPTTVARAAPEFKPNKLIATTTANSKKFDVPNRQASPHSGREKTRRVEMPSA